MLIEILRKIRELSTISVAVLAKSLNKDEALVEHMIFRLKAMGYLKEEVINNSCSGKCSGCGMICPTRLIRTVIITEKGEALLKSHVTTA